MQKYSANFSLVMTHCSLMKAPRHPLQDNLPHRRNKQNVVIVDPDIGIILKIWAHPGELSPREEYVVTQ